MGKKTKNKEVQDGLYLFYVKDEQIYPVIQTEDDWIALQVMGPALLGGKVNVYDKPMGYVENLKLRRC